MKMKMKRNLIALLLLVMGGVSACKSEKKDKNHVHQQGTSEYYTCSMHPQVHEEEPGKCPICGMELVKVVKNEQASQGNHKEANQLMLSEGQIRLANIRVDTVGRGELSQGTLLTGTLAVNPDLTETVSSRVEGRIERLYVKQTGQTIQKGAPMVDIYSEGLQTLQNEYLLALAQKRELGDPAGRYSRLVEAAAQKLLLLGMTKGQLSKIAASGKPSPVVTFFSPSAGIIQEIAVTEGQYVGEGSRIVSLSNLATLWVEAQLYSSERARVEQGAVVGITVEGMPGRFQGKVVGLNPALEANSKIVLVRLEIANPNGRLLPGMQANVLLKKEKNQTLALPMDAVLRDSKGAYVWKQTGENTFEVAMVTTGDENARAIEITSGIQPGDRVVVSGAYLLHSEYTLRKGSDPMAGMEM